MIAHLPESGTIAARRRRAQAIEIFVVSYGDLLPRETKALKPRWSPGLTRVSACFTFACVSGFHSVILGHPTGLASQPRHNLDFQIRAHKIGPRLFSVPSRAQAGACAAPRGRERNRREALGDSSRSPGVGVHPRRSPSSPEGWEVERSSIWRRGGLRLNHEDGDNRDSSLKAEVCQDSCLIASG
jgi:hypothetical protein